MPSAHVEWCSDRYRSYRAEEIYRSYSGELRTCVSPYMDTAVTASFEEEQDGMLDEGVVTGDFSYLPEERKWMSPLHLLRPRQRLLPRYRLLALRTTATSA